MSSISVPGQVDETGSIDSFPLFEGEQSIDSCSVDLFMFNYEQTPNELEAWLYTNTGSDIYSPLVGPLE